MNYEYDDEETVATTASTSTAADSEALSHGPPSVVRIPIQNNYLRSLLGGLVLGRDEDQFHVIADVKGLWSRTTSLRPGMKLITTQN